MKYTILVCLEVKLFCVQQRWWCGADILGTISHAGLLFTNEEQKKLGSVVTFDSSLSPHIPAALFVIWRHSYTVWTDRTAWHRMETLNVEFLHISNRILNTLNSILKTGYYQQDQKSSEKLLCHKFIILTPFLSIRPGVLLRLRISFNELGREIDTAGCSNMTRVCTSYAVCTRAVLNPHC